MNPTLEEKRDFAQEVSDKYQRILERHENHQPIDHDKFKISKAKYHELDWYDVASIKIGYYFLTSFIYHFLIVAPPVLIILLLITNAT